jgi:hypothetical protein
MIAKLQGSSTFAISGNNNDDTSLNCLIFLCAPVLGKMSLRRPNHGDAAKIGGTRLPHDLDRSSTYPNPEGVVHQQTGRKWFEVLFAEVGKLPDQQKIRIYP